MCQKKLTDDEIANFLLSGDLSDIEELDEGFEVNVDNLDEVLELMTEEIEYIEEIQPPNDPLPDAELVFLSENEDNEDLEYDWSNIPLGDSNWTDNTWTTPYPTCTSSLPDPLQKIYLHFITGSSINTNISEMEQYIGIHFYMIGLPAQVKTFSLIMLIIGRIPQMRDKDVSIVQIIHV
ncbi:hypothetical protein QTP88_013631 [Uroleucon formosanum]